MSATFRSEFQVPESYPYPRGSKRKRGLLLVMPQRGSCRGCAPQEAAAQAWASILLLLVDNVSGDFQQLGHA